MKKILFVFGTRPEAIKIAPLVKAMESDPYFCVRNCVTGQHKEMLDSVMSFFSLRRDYDLKVMKPNQSLGELTANLLRAVGDTITADKPDLVIVQGDTTSAFVGALAAYYAHIPVAHLEAGLRSGDKYSPFPEEINRCLVGRIAEYHFAPTELALQNLKREGITRNAWQVGNTVIDALHCGLVIIESQGAGAYSLPATVKSDSRLILVTGHRRESFGEPFKDICRAIRRIAERNPDCEFIYPVHLNPNVRGPVFELLSDMDRVHLVDPVDYPTMLNLMKSSYLVLTDSGGIQEEAPSLGKPVLVMRDVTERTEGITAGTAKLTGTNVESIVSAVETLLHDRAEYEKMAKATNPYGDGKTCSRVIEILREELSA